MNAKNCVALYGMQNTAFKLCGFKLKIPGMSKKKERCEIIQDLNDLAVVCQKNRDPFSKVHFDFKLEASAAQASKHTIYVF